MIHLERDISLDQLKQAQIPIECISETPQSGLQPGAQRCESHRIKTDHWRDLAYLMQAKSAYGGLLSKTQL